MGSVPVSKPLSDGLIHCVRGEHLMKRKPLGPRRIALRPESVEGERKLTFIEGIA